MKKNMTGCALLIVALALTGCLTTSQKPSGFLTTYEQFREGVEGGVDEIWTEPHVRTKADFVQLIAPYQNVIIDPVWINYANPEAYEDIETKELMALSDQFHLAIENAMAKRFKIVSEPRGKTIRLSIALTGVETPNRFLATTSTVMPIGLAISTISNLTTGDHTNVGVTSMELVAMDAITGKTLFAAKDRRSGNKDLGTIMDPLDDASDAFKWWSKHFEAVVLGMEKA